MADNFDPKELAGLLIPDQSTLDKAMATGNITRVSPAVRAHQTDWNGLTPQQEREKEDERLQRERQDQVLAEAEYEQTMGQVCEKADRLMTQLDAQKREAVHQLSQADARAIVLPDGRRVLVGETPGEFIDENSGQTLEGDDKAKAQSLQKSDSETAAERKQLTDRLKEIDDATDHVQKALSLSQQDGKNLTPDEKKEQETQAKDELAKAQALAAKVDAQRNHIETSSDASSVLNSTDTLSALGLDGNGRTTSFASTMDEKDALAVDLQDQFTGAGRQPTIVSLLPNVTTANSNPTSAGTTTPRSQVSQPNQ